MYRCRRSERKSLTRLLMASKSRPPGAPVAQMQTRCKRCGWQTLGATRALYPIARFGPPTPPRAAPGSPQASPASGQGQPLMAARIRDAAASGVSPGIRRVLAQKSERNSRRAGTDRRRTLVTGAATTRGLARARRMQMAEHEDASDKVPLHPGIIDLHPRDDSCVRRGRRRLGRLRGQRRPSRER